MKLPSWLRFIASRWFNQGKDYGPSLKPAVAGIAVGVAALICVIGVMNGFQLGYIEAVLELDSYHIRIKDQNVDMEQISKELDDMKASLEFVDVNTVVLGDKDQTVAMRIKIVSDDAELKDPAFTSFMEIRKGSFDNGLVLGSQVARNLNVSVGDYVSVLSLTSSEDYGLNTSFIDIPVAGIFHCGHYAFDSGLAFLNQSAASDLSLGEKKIVGIKIKDRFADQKAINTLKKLGYKDIQSWREYNKAFFGALRMEKNIMFMLVFLIFIVVGVNIFHSMRKMVHSRIEDIATLRAIGANEKDMKTIFVLNGFVSGSAGAFIGLVLGLLAVMNINKIFDFIELVVNGIIGIFSKNLKGISIFSSNVFYLSDINVRLQFPEIVFIVIAGILSAVLAAWSASARVSKILPVEVLRNE